MNNIYEEKQNSSIMAIIVFLVVAFVLIVSLVSNYYEYGIAAFRQEDGMAFLIMAVIFILLFIFFKNLKVVITTEFVQFGFGIFKKKVNKGDIKNVSIKKFEFKNYWGYGIRYGRLDRSWGYIAGNDMGVLLELENKKFYFTTDNPEQIVDLIKQNLM
ncbi:hypothetical protein ISR92_00375 [Patescibacteria group bacterium]|nr:hypothetical protein [Patescibacteria group bacterium]